MSEKRTLSESSADESEVPDTKAAKLDLVAKDLDTAGDSTDATSSSSSSSSSGSSDSSSDSDSESSGDEGTKGDETKPLNENVSHATNLNKDAPPPPVTTADISKDDSDNNSIKESNKNSQSYSVTPVSLSTGPSLANNSAQGMSIAGVDDTGGEFSIDEFQEFLQVDDVGAGPVDPVFVDHEDSQHAAHLDTLVFDSENETDQAVNSIPGFEENDGGNNGVLGVGKPVDLNFIGKRKDTFAENVDDEEARTFVEDDDGEHFKEEPITTNVVTSEVEDGEIFSSPSIPPTPGVKNSPSFKGSGAAVINRSLGGILPLEEATVTRNDSTSHSNNQVRPGTQPGAAEKIPKLEIAKFINESDAITDGETEDSESAQPPRKKKKTKKRKKHTKDTNEKIQIDYKQVKQANNCDDDKTKPKYRSKEQKNDTKDATKCHDDSTVVVVNNTSKISSQSMHSKSTEQQPTDKLTTKQTYPPSQSSSHDTKSQHLITRQEICSHNNELAHNKDSKIPAVSNLSAQIKTETTTSSPPSTQNQKPIIKKPKEKSPTATQPPSSASCPYKQSPKPITTSPSSQQDHKTNSKQLPPLPETPPQRSRPALPPQPSPNTPPVASSPANNNNIPTAKPTSHKPSNQLSHLTSTNNALVEDDPKSTNPNQSPNQEISQEPADKTPVSAFSQEKLSSESSKGSPDPESKPSSPETSSLSPPHEGGKGGSGGKSKKLSLKDYKAKKEAEKQRKMETGESGSECSSAPSSKAASRVNSKEPSPEKMDVTADVNFLEQVSDVDMEERLTSGNVVEEGEEVTLRGGLSVNLYQAVDVDVNLYPDADGLDGFDILDELDPQESDTYSSRDSGEESEESLGEEEVHALLEEAVPRPPVEKPAPIPHEKHRKLVLDERGQNVFEVLPLGWVTVTHNSGIPLYLQRETRVISTTRPYSLGAGSVRKHSIPISAIPCYNYRYYSKTDASKSDSSNSQSATTPSQSATPSHSGAPSQSATPLPNEASHTSVPAQTCPQAQTRGQPDFCKDSVSPDSTTDAEKQSSEVPVEPVAEAPEAAAAPETSSTIFPKAKIETIEDNLKETSLSAEDVHKYCSNLFVFKELEVTKFKSWKDRRSYTKEQNKKRLIKQLAARPTLPEGTKVITIPSVELASMDGTDGENAMEQTVVKKSKKEWIINPVGKSMVCLLHEYIQQSLKKQPAYKFTELDNANTPYAATVIVNGMEYGKGVGSSKKIAKSEAARKTLEILIPEIKDKLPHLQKTEETEGPDLSFFDDVRIEDPRVSDLCNRTSEPSPYIILVTCLQRNYGLGDTHITQELNMKRNQKNEYTMRVNKREVSVICKNKKDGKQLAAQKLLQQLHPHITSWGSLLRMYGNRSLRQFKQKKEKETEVTGLQSRSGNSTAAPSLAILDKLREEMRNLREIKKNAMPLGKFQPPQGLKTTGLNTDHVNL